RTSRRAVATAGKFASARTTSSPCPIARRRARQSGPSIGSMPISTASTSARAAARRYPQERHRLRRGRGHAARLARLRGHGALAAIRAVERDRLERPEGLPGQALGIGDPVLVGLDVAALRAHLILGGDLRLLDLGTQGLQLVVAIHLEAEMVEPRRRAPL